MWGRIYLIPLLQAEEDRDLVRKHYADLAREKALTGKETSAYNSDRYVLDSTFLNLAGLVPTVACCSGTPWEGGGPDTQPRDPAFKDNSEKLHKDTTELTTLICRFVRPTFAVVPGNVTK